MRQLEGRKALITGGNRGIGLAIRRSFEEAGAHVLAPTREEMDMSSSSSIESYLSKIERDFDIVVNCAGINILSPFEELEMNQMREIFQTNFFGVVQLMQGVLPHMRENRYGRVVNIESIYALISRERRVSYASSKSALSGLTRTLAVEYGPHNVLVNAVLPGYVMTDMTRKNLSPDEIAKICERIPLRRLSEPDEIAKLVLFLCSDQNTYITGQLIVADGGFTVN